LKEAINVKKGGEMKIANFWHHRRSKSNHSEKRVRLFASRRLERGQGLVEYALGLTLAALVATVSAAAIGPSMQEAYCSAVTVIDPANETCANLMGVQILSAKYNAKKNELDLMAKAPKDCTDDLEVQGYGKMVRQGSSFVFKKTISTGSPPSEVNVGNDSCGWKKTKVD
jgi:hypothetical protein